MTRLKREKELEGSASDVRFGTPPQVAAYRAERLCDGVETIIEIGAGAGYQTGAFAARAQRVVAVDIDAERLGRAVFPENVTAIVGDALAPDVIEKVKALVHGRTVVFLDPERPARSNERDINEIRPDIVKFVELYSEITPDIAIELPPFLDEIPFECEREYLSVDGELNRLTIYLGGLKRCVASVVALPSGERLEHDMSTPELVPREVDGKYLLVPDRALEHAGLTPLALPDEYGVVDLGKRHAYLVDEMPSAWFAVYRVLGSTTKDRVGELLEQSDCGTVILHGSMGQEEQRTLLRDLRRHCLGSRRLHLFLGEKCLLCERVKTEKLKY